MSDLLSGSLSPTQPIAVDGKKPKRDFLLLPREVILQNGKRRVFSDGELQGMVSLYKSMGRKLVIDYEHQTMGTLEGFENFRSPDGTAPAAAWINSLEVRPDGVWAKDVTWTPRASKMVADGEYLYHSPVIFWDGKPWQGKAVMLGPVGLTNDPDINGLSPVAARCSHEQLLTLLSQENRMDYKKFIAELLGLDANAPDDQFCTACKAKCGDMNQAVTASKQVPTLTAEVATLKNQLATATATAGEVSALKSTHGTEITALKTAHATEVTALKTAHTTEVTGLKKKLASAVADALEMTGRIKPSDKASILEKAELDADLVATAFKHVPVGAAVPIGNLNLGKGGEGVSNPHSPNDHISASKAFKDAPAETQKLHLDAVAYSDKHKVSYAEAIRQLSQQPAAT